MKHKGCRAMVELPNGDWVYCTGMPKYRDAIGRRWCKNHKPTQKVMIQWDMAAELLKDIHQAEKG